MKGQRLFIRPLTGADRSRLRDLYATEAVEFTPTPDGLIGFLVGDVAAHLGFRLEEREVEIVSLLVAAPLRRKRVATLMVRELASLAAKLEKDRLVVRKAGAADTIFHRLGFEPAADGTLVRNVE